MRSFGIQILISSPYGNLIFGIMPFHWEFDYYRMTYPVHAIGLNLGPFMFAVTGDQGHLKSIIETEDM